MAKVRVRMRSLRLRSLRMFRGLWARLKEAVAERDSPNVRLMKQPGKGKGDAVRAGFAEARGDILMILDADLTVPAEMLPRFYEAVASGRAEFANGTRLVYQMDDRAMRFLNLLGNHFFAFGFTYVMGQPVRDTLCGTKVLTRESYQDIANNRSYFGDFERLFDSAHLNMKILDVPIRCRKREYRDTNISRFRHGLLLLGLLFVGARNLKFREFARSGRSTFGRSIPGTTRRTAGPRPQPVWTARIRHPFGVR